MNQCLHGVGEKQVALILPNDIMVTLETYTPTRLSSFVKSFWCLKISGDAHSSYKEDILPDGHHEIIFHLTSNAAKRNIENNDSINEPDFFFAGQTLKRYSLELKNSAVVYGIRFYPHTLAPLYNLPAELLTENVLSLTSIPRTEILTQCVTENVHETFHNFESALTTLVYKANISSNAYKYVNDSVLSILQYKGDISIDRLTNTAGVSAKYFDTLFKKFVGINPKVFCTIVKLNYFINFKNNHPHKSFTECAYQANFYDQSHLIKLFKEMTGNTPKNYFKSDNHINNQFSGL